MGLSALKKVKPAPEVPALEVDLSEFADGEPVILRFRQPKAHDYFPPDSLRRQLFIAFPELTQASEILPQYILIFSACYIPEPGEQGQEPWRALANLGRVNPDILLYLIQRFGEAFPSSLGDMKAEVKNA